MSKIGKIHIPIAVLLTFLILSITPRPALSSFKIEPHRIILDNGITLLVVENHALPIVNISMAIKAGAIYDPQGKEGTANLTAILLDEGTKTRSSKKIAEEVDFIGASLSTSGGREYSTVKMTLLRKDIEKGLEILSDILLHPQFPQEEVERKKKEIIAGIIAEKDDPGAVAFKAFHKALFPKHPYGSPVEGEEDSVNRILREDIIDFYKKFYRPNNTIIAVVGDISTEEAVEIINHYFKKWKKREISFPEIPTVIPLKEKETIFIDKDITQANIVLGHTGISRDNPDFYAAYVLNYIFGGGSFSSRLTREIRDTMGLAYAIYSRFSINKYPGYFAIMVQTRNKEADKTIESILSELRKIRKEPVSDEEINDAKSYLTGSFPLKINTNAKIANYLLFIEHYNLGLDYFDRYAHEIERVTKEDILRVAKKYLDPEHYILVVVGNIKETGLQEKGEVYK